MFGEQHGYCFIRQLSLSCTPSKQIKYLVTIIKLPIWLFFSFEESELIKVKKWKFQDFFFSFMTNL